MLTNQLQAVSSKMADLFKAYCRHRRLVRGTGIPAMITFSDEAKVEQSIEQIFFSDFVECFKGSLPTLDDGSWILPFLDGLKDLSGTDERECFIDLEIVGIKPIERTCYFHSEGGRL